MEAVLVNQNNEVFKAEILGGGMPSQNHLAVFSQMINERKIDYNVKRSPADDAWVFSLRGKIPISEITKDAAILGLSFVPYSSDTAVSAAAS